MLCRLHSLEPEIAQLAARGSLDERAAAELAARESGRLFSVHFELTAILYLGVAAVITGTGLLLREHFDQIGPATLLLLLLVASAACFVVPVRAALRGQERGTAGDYILLLAALLLSTAVGYAEIQFHGFAGAWSRQLFVLAAVHALIAYTLDSRLVLSLSLTAFAGAMGLSMGMGDFAWGGRTLPATGARALACSALFLVAGLAHRRWARGRDFAAVFDHFAAHLAFGGALALLWDGATRGWGLGILLALAAVIGLAGFRRGREVFVLYALGYMTLGLWFLLGQLVHDRLVQAAGALALVLGAATALWLLRTRMRMPTGTT